MHDAVIVGGGLAGFSAAIYLARAQRETLVITSGKSMAVWEPHVENYLGFPEGISGEELVERGRRQALCYGAKVAEDEIVAVAGSCGAFELQGRRHTYAARRILLATGLYHLPPEIEGVPECLGHSMFFCKDCDGFRIQGQSVIVYGWNNEAVEYALALLLYSPIVALVTDGRSPKWDAVHAAWVKEYQLPVYVQEIARLNRVETQIRSLVLADGQEVFADALFTTRGDLYFNQLARKLGAHLDAEGQVEVNEHQATSVPGVYAAGCLTPANCQMIIAAGQGAVAAQAINRDLFEESLRTHSLRRFRERQLRTKETQPAVVPSYGRSSAKAKTLS